MDGYIRKCVLPLDEVVQLVERHFDVRKTRIELQGHSVGVTSLRLRTFATAALKNPAWCCVSCGLKPKFFAIEESMWNKQAVDKPHLNLYGVTEAGEEKLFTHDHVLARALGGADNLSNTQVMCSPCNSEKSVHEQREVDKLKGK